LKPGPGHPGAKLINKDITKHCHPRGNVQRCLNGGDP